MPSATSTFNVLDGLALPSGTTVPSPTTVIVKPTPEPVEQTPASVDTVQSESQMCRDLPGMMEQFPGTSAEERREALTNLRTESVASADWQSKTASEQASMNRAFEAAMSGEC